MVHYTDFVEERQGEEVEDAYSTRQTKEYPKGIIHFKPLYIIGGNGKPSKKTP
jgi:hypothetical protein